MHLIGKTATNEQILVVKKTYSVFTLRWADVAEVELGLLFVFVPAVAFEATTIDREQFYQINIR